MILKPKALKKGDLIAIAASASPFDVQEFEKGVSHLKKMGFEVVYRPDIFDKKSFLAGSDERRASELNSYLENPSIKAILFARGGWGTTRILPLLNKEKFKSHPKIVLGYSDMTSLLLYLQHLNWVVFHGPVVARGLGDDFQERSQHSLLEILTQENPLTNLWQPECETVLEGEASGTLTGGCISLLVCSLKTPWEFNADGKILFIEDVNESPYKIDRMLTHLKFAGKLELIKGVICGPLHPHSNTNVELQNEYKQILKEHFSKQNIPVIYNIPSGHLPNMICLPMGIDIQVNTRSSQLAYLEGALHAA